MPENVHSVKDLQWTPMDKFKVVIEVEIVIAIAIGKYSYLQGTLTFLMQPSAAGGRLMGLDQLGRQGNHCQLSAAMAL